MTDDEILTLINNQPLQQKIMDLATEQEAKSFAYSKQRMEICNSCDKLLNPVKVCRECFCFMPGKVLMKDVDCPIGKWGPVDE